LSDISKTDGLDIKPFLSQVKYNGKMKEQLTHFRFVSK